MNRIVPNDGSDELCKCADGENGRKENARESWRAFDRAFPRVLLISIVSYLELYEKLFGFMRRKEKYDRLGMLDEIEYFR